MGNGSSSSKISKTSEKDRKDRKDSSWEFVNPFDIPEWYEKHKEKELEKFRLQRIKLDYARANEELDMSSTLIIETSPQPKTPTPPPLKIPTPKPSLSPELSPSQLKQEGRGRGDS